MNILYICADPGIPIGGHKGAAVHVLALTDAFAALGHRVMLLSPRPGPDDTLWPGARLVRVVLPNPAVELSAEDREVHAREIAAATYETALESHERAAFDFIYERYSLWSDAGARLARDLGLPLVVEVNAPLQVEAVRYRTLHHTDLAAEIEARVFSAASAIGVVSAPLREYVVARGIPEERVRVLPNAVDERLFHPAVNGDTVRARLGLTGKMVVGFVGTVKPWHDLDTLIRAVGRLRDQPPASAKVHLLLVGDIPPSVRETIRQFGLTDFVTIVEPIPHNQVPSYIAAMNVAVSPHPALADFYFSPLKLFEYLACNVATVAANVRPIAEIVAEGTSALLYPPGDVGALAERIAFLASNPSARTELAWRGAMLVLREHTWRRNAEQVTNWLSVPTMIRSPHHSGNGETGVAVTAPRLDEKLRAALYTATRADLAAPLIAAHLNHATREEWDLAHLQVLKYIPGRRCVIEYDLRSRADQKPRAVIGKVFKDERGGRLYDLLRALWADGFAASATDCITLAEPLSFIPELRMLLQERAPGQTLDELVGARDFVVQVRRSAEAIAKLHSSRIRPSNLYTLDDELAQLACWGVELQSLHPERTDSFERQLAALRIQAAALPPADSASVHRDFYYAQVLFDDDRVTLIDLDLLSRADPAIDVANFAAHLRFLALQQCGNAYSLEAARQGFVDEYLSRRHADVSGFLTRVVFYEAATYFRLMRVALQRPHLAPYFDVLFELAEREALRASFRQPEVGERI